MTEEYKLPVFFKFNQEKIRSDMGPTKCVKLVFVCEDSNPRALEHLTILSEAIFRDLRT
jgi:hypothetical protein